MRELEREIGQRISRRGHTREEAVGSERTGHDICTDF